MTHETKSLQTVFSKTVERTANEGGITIVESCCAVAERFGIDVEDIPKFLTERVKDQIETESREANLIFRGCPKQKSIDEFFE